MKSAKIFFIKIIFFLCIACMAEDDKKNTTKIFGISLPPHVTPIGENRFLSSRSYEDTKREWRERLSKIKSIRPLSQEINLPQVRAIFYQNIDEKAEFYAINIYLNVQTGLTEIFLVKNKTKKDL